MFMLHPTAAHWCPVFPLGQALCSKGVECVCRTRAPSPPMCRYVFQTPFFPWACSFRPGAREGPGIGFSIITEVTAWCLLI